jgi:hypothetical protein
MFYLDMYAVFFEPTSALVYESLRFIEDGKLVYRRWTITKSYYSKNRRSIGV